jgi:redox-sensitive bicupin YhaK (pirin superfamily)
VSNLEDRPDEVRAGRAASASERRRDPAGDGTGVEVLAPREVPLGGPRAMTVRRTLPSRERSLIGAWCFLDHYGPDDVAETGGMSVAPHPHTGLQTASWLFSGEIEHRDSAGHHAFVRPGELNLMTAGHGISHTEVSTPATTELHGAQLWIALPEAARDGAPGFAHHVPDPVTGDGWTARVFLGSLLGSTSPVETATPLLGAELLLEPGAEVELDLDPAFEHGVLVDTGAVSVAGRAVDRHELAYLAPGTGPTTVRAADAEGAARLLVLGGPPFGEAIVMWWNFVGRTHEEVVGFREQWQAQLGGGAEGRTEGEYADGRFGVPVGNDMAPIPAPALPNARLRERR